MFGFCVWLARKGFGSEPRGISIPDQTVSPYPPYPHRSPARFAGPPLLVYQPKAIFAISLKRFLAQHSRIAIWVSWGTIEADAKADADADVEAGAEAFARCPSHYQNEIIVYHAARRPQNCTRFGAVNGNGNVDDVVAYLFLIIFVKAGEIFGIYESAAWLALGSQVSGYIKINIDCRVQIHSDTTGTRNFGVSVLRYSALGTRHLALDRLLVPLRMSPTPTAIWSWKSATTFCGIAVNLLCQRPIIIG